MTFIGFCWVSWPINNNINGAFFASHSASALWYPIPLIRGMTVWCVHVPISVRVSVWCGCHFRTYWHRFKRHLKRLLLGRAWSLAQSKGGHAASGACRRSSLPPNDHRNAPKSSGSENIKPNSSVWQLQGTLSNNNNNNKPSMQDNTGQCPRWLGGETLDLCGTPTNETGDGTGQRSAV